MYRCCRFFVSGCKEEKPATIHFNGRESTNVRSTEIDSAVAIVIAAVCPRLRLLAESWKHWFFQDELFGKKTDVLHRLLLGDQRKGSSSPQPLYPREAVVALSNLSRQTLVFDADEAPVNQGTVPEAQPDGFDELGSSTTTEIARHTKPRGSKGTETSRTAFAQGSTGTVSGNQQWLATILALTGADAAKVPPPLFPE